jgi:uncharacterized protein YlaI
VKIIDEKPFGFEFECESCKSRLQAEADDVRIGYYGANYGGERPVRGFYVKCPVCETEKRLEDSDVPPKVRTLAQLKERD